MRTKKMFKLIAALLAVLMVFMSVGAVASADMFRLTLGRYTVRWYIGDEYARLPERVSAGEVATYNTKIYGVPEKQSNRQYNYVFLGWNTNPFADEPLGLATSEDGKIYYSQEVHSDISYFAIFAAVEKPAPVRYYTVTWKNYDGTVLHKSSKEIKAGDSAYYNLTLWGTPTRREDSRYTYEFIGWSQDKNATEPDELAFVEGRYFTGAINKDTTFYAVYKQVSKSDPANLITLNWYTDEGELLYTEQVEKGTRPEYNEAKGGNLIKLGYTFDGWSYEKGGSAVTLGKVYENTDLYAVYKQDILNVFLTVLWKNYDETVLLASEDAIITGTPAYYSVLLNGTPERPDDDDYTYTFAGWSTNKDATEPDAGFTKISSLYVSPALTADTAFYAIYTKTAKPVYHTVSWYDMNGDLIYSENVVEGTTAAYNIIKGGSLVEVGYTFKGWSNEANGELVELGAVTEDVSYYAVYDEIKALCTVNWYSGSTLMFTEQVVIGTTASYKGQTPTKAADNYYTYEFAGWSLVNGGTTTVTPGVVLSDTDYYAVFNKSDIYYTITWKNGAASTTEKYKFGETPVYKDATPTKAAVGNKTYEFTGWKPAITAVVADATYTAQFKEIDNGGGSPITDDSDNTFAAVAFAFSALGLAVLALNRKNEVDE